MINEIQPDTKLPKMKFYTVYTALLTQSGTGNPTAHVLQNNTEWTWVFTRYQTGGYEFVLPAAIDPEKVWVTLATGPYDGKYLIVFDGTYMIINTANAASEAADNMLNNTPIEIRVYRE